MARSAVTWATACALTIAAAMSAAPARAQAPRNGDVSGGLDHQPTRPEVRAREAAGGVKPPADERRREDGDIDQLYDTLTGHPRPGSAAAPEPAPR